MSLGGIAIAIGAMVDASIIMVENAHKKMEEWVCDTGKKCSRLDVIIDASKEVGPSLFFSLLVITVGFLPIFTLQAQAGRLFKPLAYTKTFAMLFSSFLAVTLTPVLMSVFVREDIPFFKRIPVLKYLFTIYPEENHPVSVVLRKVYEPVAKFALRYKKIVIILTTIIMVITFVIFILPGVLALFDISLDLPIKLGSEFMPPLYEGSLLYMPVTVPAVSVPVASDVLRMQDKILMSIPEVSQVFGKAGRAETATDPAPIEMFETVVNLKPEEEWRKGMDVEKLKNEMNDALQIPGVANSFTMPIKNRIDMLATGIRTPVGVKVLGPKLDVIEKISTEVEEVIKSVPGTRSAYAERVTTGYFLDIRPRRSEIARYGLSMDDVQSIVASALGGMNLTTTVEGRERYPVNVRYSRELRNDIEKIKRIFVPVNLSGDASGMQPPARGGGLAHIPLGELADIEIVKGPTSIKSEEGLLANYVYIDFSGRDMGGYVEEAKKKVASTVKLPEGYRLIWSGEYENIVSTHERLKLVAPLTALIIFLLIYFNTKSVTKTAIVLLAVPFSLVGSFWFLYILNYNMSIAVWVGIIALAGLDAETGVVMLLYLELAHEQWKKEGKLRGMGDLKEAVMHGAVQRIRPKIMTVSVILAGLIPIMFSHGAGADVMKRIAAPMVGGVLTSTILELVIYPAIYMIWKGREFRKQKEVA
jgi:Cu(I)/Ag(I) efflux system membrane protein CusA/SilA